MPTPSHPEGKIIGNSEILDVYENATLVVSFVVCILKVKEFFHSLYILNEPDWIRTAVSKNKLLENEVKVLVDTKAPLFSLVPIFKSVFKLDNEFSFLYVEGPSSGTPIFPSAMNY